MSNTPSVEKQIANVDAAGFYTSQTDLLPPGTVTKAQALSNIDNQISSYETLKEQCAKLYIDNFSKLQDYTGKLEKAKEDFSKKYFTKKTSRYRKNSVAILEQMEVLDKSIANMQRLKDKLLTPTEIQSVEDTTSTTETQG